MIARIFAELNKPKRALLYVTSMKVSMFLLCFKLGIILNE